MRPCAALVVTALASLVPSLAGQGTTIAPAPHSWTRGVVHYGKWATAASAIGFTVLAGQEHSAANRRWQQLLNLCRRDNQACTQRPDGIYVDDTAESLYQETVYYDHRARRRLLVGQVSLLASATLFILDLRNQGDGPPNIPFHGMEVTAEPAGNGVRVGLRMPF